MKIGTMCKNSGRVATTVVIGLLAGCCFHGGDDEPVMGHWESVDNVGGYYNYLYIDAEYHGDGLLYFTLSDDDDDTIYYLNFRAEADVVREDENYVIRMICDDDFDCSDFDFTMSCQAQGIEVLSCVGDGAFEGYGILDFERIRQ